MLNGQWKKIIIQFTIFKETIMNNFVDVNTAEFKSETDCSKLDEIIFESCKRQIVICATTPIGLYKIKNRIKKVCGFSEETFIMIDGEEMEMNLQTTRPIGEDMTNRITLDIRRYIDNMIEIYGDVSNRWIVMDGMTRRWGSKIALHFITKLQKLGAIGILFYSNEKTAENFSQVNIEMNNLDAFQFPIEKYSYKHMRMDDGF